MRNWIRLEAAEIREVRAQVIMDVLGHSKAEVGNIMGSILGYTETGGCANDLFTLYNCGTQESYTTRLHSEVASSLGSTQLWPKRRCSCSLVTFYILSFTILPYKVHHLIWTQNSFRTMARFIYNSALILPAPSEACRKQFLYWSRKHRNHVIQFSLFKNFIYLEGDFNF